MVRKGSSHAGSTNRLPYTEDGVVPDVMINPHAFPSRIPSSVHESLGGKAASLRGKIVDGSAFLGEKGDDIKNAMEQYGFKYTGKVQCMTAGLGESSR